jgi:predicted metalloprotease with PDZ domain
LAGFVENREGILSKIRIGAFEIPGVEVDDGPDECLLGTGCLRRFRVTFDLPNGRLYLARGDRFNVSDTLNRVGLFLLRREGHTLVRAVCKGSSAEEAGIHAEDELIAIDDETVDGMRLADVWWKLGTLSKSDGALKLQLIRNGENTSVSVIPHE